MEHLIQEFINPFPTSVLFIIIAVMLFVLSKGADILVDEAVSISLAFGVSKVLIGATLVSIGTTLPEAAVSVLAAFSGNPGLALGNAVGSIICDTGLILGLAALISPLPIERELVNRQGWIQFGAGALLVIVSLPFSRLSTIFDRGGLLPQWAGFLFVALLIAYFAMSLKWSKGGDPVEGIDIDHSAKAWIFVKLVIGVVLVIVSSRVLIPTVELTASRVGVPDNIIAATLVAFGTSLPELVTAMTAVRKGHGELAIGNVVGADILNVLFVAGAAAAVTPGGLEAGPFFFRIAFPAMLGLLIVFRLGIFLSKKAIGRVTGGVLLATYLFVTVISYR